MPRHPPRRRPTQVNASAGGRTRHDAARRSGRGRGRGRVFAARLPRRAAAAAAAEGRVGSRPAPAEAVVSCGASRGGRRVVWSGVVHSDRSGVTGSVQCPADKLTPEVSAAVSE